MAAKPTSELAISLAHVLECASLCPGLRSIILFNTTPDALFSAARGLVFLLKTVTGRQFRTVTLTSADNEDDLWVTPGFKASSSEAYFTFRPGRLAPPSPDSASTLVVVPDLARLSLPAARACVSLMGDPASASLQRHGLNLTWSPDMCWLAGCARAQVGEVSQHLIDRFALRLTIPEDSSGDHTADVMAWASGASQVRRRVQGRLYRATRQRLQRAKGYWPVFSEPALSQVLSYFRQGGTHAGVRRELTLARLSRAIARLAGAPSVLLEHVEEAAHLISLRPENTQPGGRTIAPTSQPKPAAEEWASGPPDEASDPRAASAGTDLSVENSGEVVFRPDSQTAFNSALITPTPYPEDTTPPAREAEPLKLPPRRYSSAKAVTGPIIGTQPAIDYTDLALVSTIIEAAKFQKVRPPLPSGEPSFPIYRSDLRSYRRAPAPEQLLVLLMDYTCLRNCDWESALWQHLRWAYIERAGISIVQVGLNLPGNGYLRAQQVTTRNLLSPRIRAALEAEGGGATPLAHGLDVAIRTLRSALQHGRSKAQQARLVVLTDGRGNIPLAASYSGSLKTAVTREGIDDALRLAHDLSKLNNVDIYLLNPQPEQYPDLPLTLARTLGAVVEDIPPKEVT